MSEKWMDETDVRMMALEAEIERQKGLVRNYQETIEGNEIDIQGLLDQVKSLKKALSASDENWRYLKTRVVRAESLLVQIVEAQAEWVDDYYSARDCSDEIDEILADWKKA